MIDPFWLGLMGTVLLVVLIMLRVPIAFVLTGIGTVGIMMIFGPHKALVFLPNQLYTHIAKFTFTAVPLFLLMGYFVFHAGLTKEAYDAARSWVGRVPGGMAVTTVTGCALLAATSGSSLAECAAMAKIAVPEMRRSGYSMRLATGVVASAGGMAVVIPPSIIMVIFGVITETSVGKLLIAGILPGILYFAIFSIAIIAWAYFFPSSAPRELGVDTSFRARLRSLRQIWGIAVLFVLVMGGIYSGFVTPTEAAALGAVGAALLALIKGKLTWENLKSSILETVTASAMIFLLLAGASIFTTFLSVSGIVASATDSLVELELRPVYLFMGIILLYIVLGMFLDTISMMILSLPLVLPILEAQNMSLIWFGVIMCMMAEIGCITPPMGLNVYVIKGALGKSVDLNDIFIGAAPFILLELLIIVILYLFPEIALWLPRFMEK